MTHSGDKVDLKRWAWVNEMTEDELEWLERLPFTYTLRGLRLAPGGRLAAAGDKDPIVVHAGLVPGVPLHKQLPQDMVMLRNLEVVEGGGNGEGQGEGGGEAEVEGRGESQFSALERDDRVGWGGGSGRD